MIENSAINIPLPKTSSKDYHTPDSPVVLAAKTVLKSSRNHKRRRSLSDITCTPATVFDGASCGLLNFPSSIMSEGVTSINLSQNRIRFLPETLLSFSHLKTLNLSGNPLGEVRDLSSLQSLQVLDLSDTGLTQVPEWIRKSSLKIINLRDNCIDELPAWFYMWSSNRSVTIDDTFTGSII